VFPSFTRLSIDGILASRHGIYSVDYPATEYAAHLEEARQLFATQAREMLDRKKDVVLDSSFYAKRQRDEYRVMIDEAGGRLVLVYLKADREVLWKRICARREKGVNADSARNINPELLDHFVMGFEAPEGEGEIVVTTDNE
jgi:predicted kinase